MQKKHLPVCDMEDSIKQYLSLILTTHFGECRYDNNFGCEIWDWNFDNIHSINKWKSSFNKQVAFAIEKNEKRLKNIEVKIELVKVRNTEKGQVTSSRLRQKIFISITGTMINTNMPLYHQEMIFFSPLSQV